MFTTPNVLNDTVLKFQLKVTDLARFNDVDYVHILVRSVTTGPLPPSPPSNPSSNFSFGTVGDWASDSNTKPNGADSGSSE